MSVKRISKSYDPKTECACGKRLHYTNLAEQDAISGAINASGGDPFVVVKTGDKAWRVQRHYIALHGIKASELPGLGFQQLLGGTPGGLTPEEAMA